MKTSPEFLSLYNQLKNPAKINNIPPKMLDKLTFLAKKILKQQIKRQQFINIQQQEFNGLSILDQQTKINLFISVASCILGRVQLDYVSNKQVYMKNYNDLIAFWKLVYVMYDSENMYITKNSKKQTFCFDKLRISKTHKKRGNKYSFKIKMQSKQYLIGTVEEKICTQLLNKLKQMINNKKIERQNKQKVQYVSLPSQFSCIHDIQQIFDDKVIQQQQLNPIVEQFNIQEIQDQSNYQLKQSGDNYRILNHINNKNIYKIFTTVDTVNTEDIIELFIKNKQWNIQTIDSKIINKIQNNMYIVYQKFKNYSYTSWQRDFVLLKYSMKYKNKYYLLEKSVQHTECPHYKSFVRGNVKSKVSVFISGQNTKKYTIIITRIDIDFKGYNSAEDNRLMTEKYLKSFGKFPNYCLQRSLLLLNKKMFNFNKVQPKIMIKQKQQLNQRQNDLNSSRSNSFNPYLVYNINDSVNLKQQINILKQQQLSPIKTNQFLDCLPTYLTDKINQKILKFIQNHSHHSHHIFNKYSFQTHNKATKKHNIQKPNDFIFQNGDWILNSQNQMVFVNKAAIQAQKDTIKWIFKQIGANILKGKSIMNMSLPVDVFDNRSALQRSTASYGYAPIYFSEASKTLDQVQQIKWVANFLISLVLLQLRIQKPFNPILGQTFQGYLGGIPFYAQQISHHPPITAFYAKTKDFQFHGHIDSHAELGLNSCYAANYGAMNVKFTNTGLLYECFIPACQVSGLLYGQRKFKLVNKGFVLCKQKALICQISFGKQKKDIYPAKTQKTSSNIFGGIFKITKQFINRFISQKKKPKFNGVTVSDILKTHSILSGAWNDSILFDNKIYKTLYDPAPYQLQYQLYPLASNSNYRTDILYRRLGDLALAQSQKQRLQVLQRGDRKLRQKFKK